MVHNVLKYNKPNFTSTFTPSCNWDYRNNNLTVCATPTASTYCFLSKALFQNGLIAFICAKKPAYIDSYYIEFSKQENELEYYYLCKLL